MALLKKLMLLLVLILGLVLGVWLSVDNSQQVRLSLLGSPLAPLSLGLLVCLVFALGTLLGYLLTLGPLLSLKNHNLSLRRKLGRRDKELARLRKAPVSKNSLTTGKG